MTIYIAEGGQSNRVLGLTCRHMLFLINKNTSYHHETVSAPARTIQLLGTKAFNNLLTSIKICVGQHGLMVEQYNRQIVDLMVQVDNTKDKEDIKAAKKELRKVNTGGKGGLNQRIHCDFIMIF